MICLKTAQHPQRSTQLVGKRKSVACWCVVQYAQQEKSHEKEAGNIKGSKNTAKFFMLQYRRQYIQEF